MFGSLKIKPVAVIKTPFKEKFGIPRQSGRVAEIKGEIVFFEEFNDENALRGIEQFSHLWLIFGFSANEQSKKPSLTVRPPRLGGNRRLGVFATRSPFRPNPIGLSCVKLESVNFKGGKLSLTVSGVDLLDGTPIYDIKPYIPYCDCKENALGGFATEFNEYKLKVEFSADIKTEITDELKKSAIALIAEDPRPSYQDDPVREYFLVLENYQFTFKVKDKTATVTDINKTQ